MCSERRSRTEGRGSEGSRADQTCVRIEECYSASTRRESAQATRSGCSAFQRPRLPPRPAYCEEGISPRILALRRSGSRTLDDIEEVRDELCVVQVPAVVDHPRVQI